MNYNIFEVDNPLKDNDILLKNYKFVRVLFLLSIEIVD